MKKRDKIELTTVNVEQVEAKVGRLHLTKEATGLSQNNFGTVVNYKMPEGAGAVVLCANYGAGLKTVRILLPGQVYTKTLEKLAKDPMVREIVLIPVRAHEYITIAAK